MAKHKDEKEKKKGLKVVQLFFLIIAIATSLFAIYEIFLLNSIEDLIRYIIIGVLLIIDLILIFKVKSSKKNKKTKRVFLVLFMILYSCICGVIGGAIFYVYGQINSINKVYVTYSSSLIAMKDSEINDIEDVSDLKIGLLSDKKSPEGYIIPNDIIKEYKLKDENDMVEYDDYSTMLVDLYAEEIDCMFVSSSYVSMFSNITGYENIDTDTKVIISKDKKMKKADTSDNETASSGKNITEPFTILLMGIDSTDEVLTKNAVANGDTLILITFNPKTLNATMLSIPRDSYVPIACWSDKAENKITHAAGYGTDCMMNTIENYFDTDIDYYAKINFKGLVKLVDAVGGVEVEVPKRLCTDNSSRDGEICIDAGWQTLNGEQALVFARNRHDLENGDFGRAQHQQEIIMALVNKMKTITDVSKFMDILNTISNSLDTNLTTKQILSFYNIGKDILKKSLSADEAELVNIQQLYLQGVGQMIYDERIRLVLWDYIPNNQSRKDIIQAMKVNLELEDHEIIKEFSFSINEPYEKEVIGEGPYKTSNSYKLLPNFVGDSEAQARASASRLGINVTFKGTGGYVVSQSVPANKRLDKLSGSVELVLSQNTTKDDSTDKKNTDKDKDKNKDKTDNDKDNDENEDLGNTDENEKKDVPESPKVEVTETPKAPDE